MKGTRQDAVAGPPPPAAAAVARNRSTMQDAAAVCSDQRYIAFATVSFANLRFSRYVLH